MTSPLHGEDRRFESGQAHCFFEINTKERTIPHIRHFTRASTVLEAFVLRHPAVASDNVRARIDGVTL